MLLCITTSQSEGWSGALLFAAGGAREGAGEAAGGGAAGGGGVGRGGSG